MQSVQEIEYDCKRDPLVYLFDENNELVRVQPNEDLVCLADSTVDALESSTGSYAPSYSCDQITDSSIECQATSCKYNRCNCKAGFTQNGLNCEIGWYGRLKNKGNNL